MTYSREVTGKIVECWGLGFTAEETVKAIEEWKSVKIGLATVYRHRHSLTAQDMIDELMRKQFRDIAKEDNSELRMRFRNELLKILIPQKLITLQRTEVSEKVDISILSQYDLALRRAAETDIMALRDKQPVDSKNTQTATT
jgi:hypothetical protein